MAGLYHGHILEFPQIRVDCFTTPPTGQPWMLPDPRGLHLPCRPAPPARLFLLTHVHSDHLVGLSDNFTGTIICSPDTKSMLLKLEAEKERLCLADGSRERRKRKYEGLKAKTFGKGTKDERVVDRIEAVPYGVAREYELGFENGKPIKVRITLIDANHCPGSTMFLMTSSHASVLHTGDVRADDLCLRSLRRDPALAPYFVPSSKSPSVKMGMRGGRKSLDRIYLDTSAMVGTGDMPEKEMVLNELIDQMRLYPESTIFFLDVWCFGWEDVVKEVARCFYTPVHVDRYKREIYSSIQSDRYLSACTTSDPTLTRFHACERKARCEGCRIFDKGGNRVYNTDKLVVKVSMVECKSAAYEIERLSFLSRLGEAAAGQGSWPFNIYCPIARHSPLPELQKLVKMFQPSALSPNTLVLQFNGMDYFILPQLFGDCLSDNAVAKLVEERDSWFKSTAQFGEVYKRGLTAAAPSAPYLEVDIDMDLLLAQAAVSSPIGASRRDHAREQVIRSVPATLSATALFLPASIRPNLATVDDVEYDTDESSHQKKRPKVTAPPATEASPHHTLVFGSNPLSDSTPKMSGSPIDLLEQPKFPKRRVRRVRPSILVDRDHLRALVGVAGE